MSQKLFRHTEYEFLWSQRVTQTLLYSVSRSPIIATVNEVVSLLTKAQEKLNSFFVFDTVKNEIFGKQDRQCKYNVILSRVRQSFLQ